MKVFLVEDSAAIRARLHLRVAEAGASVVGEADNQHDAIHGICSNPPHLVILDLALAEGNGVEVLRCVKSSFPQTKVIILSNYSSAPYRSKCSQLGADYFLDKNQEFEALGPLLLSEQAVNA